MSQLPIIDVLPKLLTALSQSSQIILKAPPGAGKSTHFPLSLLNAGIVDGKIIMLEPRRLAVRNIAHYLASQLNEAVGERVGYRMRGEQKVGPNTQLEIVTEGVMMRLLQQDPELSGIGCLIFDEFHERSLPADTALAFSLESQAVFRDDLKIVVMSATLESMQFQDVLPQATYIESQGREFPVDIHYRPLKVNERLLVVMANQIQQLMARESGSLLAFLPGVGAIRHLQELLSERLSSDIDVCPLYGQLSMQAQQQAITPALGSRRKVVLATNIAETSLTIEGIHMVVDSGLEKIARFDLRTGITRLDEVSIAQSSAQQRAGRAGRLAAGLCVRMYSESHYHQQPTMPVPAILQSDLSGLALDIAQWGAATPHELAWINPPSDTAFEHGRSVLRRLGLMNADNQLTSLGHAAQQFAMEPRMAAMLLKAQESPLLGSAIALATLLEEPEKNTLDMRDSLLRWQGGQHAKQSRLHARAKQLAAMLECDFVLPNIDSDSLAMVACLAFPDRIAQSRGAQNGRFLLSNGHGAELVNADSFTNSDYLVALDIMRLPQVTRMVSVIRLPINRLQTTYPDLFTKLESVDWDEQRGKLCAEQHYCLGKLIIERKRLPAPGQEKMTQALLNYVARQGLNVLKWDAHAMTWLSRVRCAIEWLPQESWPDMSDEGLLTDLDDWLAPYLVGINSATQLKQVSVYQALHARLGWPLNQSLETWLPPFHCVPTGHRYPIRYQEGKPPMLSVRIQEVFGEQTSPVIAQGTQTVVMELLSPARRPIQITQDLAGFWQGSYRDVQKEMKGRYPKHIWPDDPAHHVATTKTKR
ncbi:MAG: ATP-dependent helicase HrpB, partial [Vibrio sp.]